MIERDAKTPSPTVASSPARVSEGRSRSSTPGALGTDWTARLGNRAAHDAILAAWSAPHEGPAAERSASAMADAVTGRRSPGGRDAHDARPGTFSMPTARGEHLADSLRRPLERATGESFAGVEVHRGRLAHRNVVAATQGSRIAIDERAASGPDASWIIAHELGHVLQQRRQGTTTTALYPGDGNDALFREGEVMADFDMGGDESDPMVRYHRETEVEIVGASLRDPAASTPRSELDIERVTFRGVDDVEQFTLYAIPIADVTNISLPDVDTASTAGAPPPRPPPPPPAVGDTVTTLDGLRHTVLGASADFIVSETFTRYATGAASMGLARTPEGYFLVDAGRAGPPSRSGTYVPEAGTLTRALIDKVRADLRGERIRGVLLTHAHADHFTMLSSLALEMDLGDIIINEAQARHPSYVNERARVEVAIRERLRLTRERLLADTAARDAYVAERMLRPGADVLASPAGVAREWQAEVNRRMAGLPPTREVTVRTEGGRLRPMVMRTLGLPTDHPDAAERPATDLEIALDGPNLIGFADPALNEQARIRGREVDRFASHWLLEFDGGQRFIVIPDDRALDLTPELKRSFIAAVNALPADATGTRRHVNIWDATHHMQSGFGEGEGERHERGSEARAEHLMQAIEFMHEFRAAASAHGPGHDAVVTSANPERVSVGTLNLLRAAGIEPFLAIDGEDVRIYDLLLHGGERLTGVRGRSAGDRSMTQSVRRGMAAAESIRARRDALVEERNRAEPSERAALEERISELEAQSRELRPLQRACTQAIDAARSADGMHGEVSSHEPVSRAVAALDGWLTRNNFPEIVASGSLELTTTALYLIGAAPADTSRPGTPEADAHARGVELARLRSTIVALRGDLRHASAADAPALHTQLYDTTLAFREALNAALPFTEEGTTRRLYQSLIAAADQEIATPIHVSDGEVTHTRSVTGELFEVQVIAEQSARDLADRVARRRTLTTMMRGLEVVGRGMGGLMVITSVRGTADTLQRYEAGKSNAAQTIAGLAHQATSGVIGVQMLRGAHVGPGSFVILSALEVGEAALGDYDSTDERDLAITRAVVHGAVNVGCMVAGDAIMAAGAATLNPVVFAVGAVVSFLAPLIINALFDIATTPVPFQPRVMTDLYEDLQELLGEYRLVVGNVLLSRRTGYRAAVLGEEPQIAERAEAQALAHHNRARELEPLVLDAFGDAYGEARTNHVGLQQLDAWRREFLDLQLAATPEGLEPEANAAEPPLVWRPGGVAPAVDADETTLVLHNGWPRLVHKITRAETIERFRAIETTLVDTSAALTPRDVREMSQWTRLDREMNELRSAIVEHETWAHVASKLDQVEAMIDNARYRIEPSGGLRTSALIPTDTGARLTYEAMLADAERTLHELRLLLNARRAPEAPPEPPLVVPILSRDAYDLTQSADTTDYPLVLRTEAPTPLFPAGVLDAGQADPTPRAFVLPDGSPLWDISLPGNLMLVADGSPVLPLVPSPEHQAVSEAQDAVNAFEDALGRHQLPEGFTPDAVHARSSEVNRYHLYIESHRDFRMLLAEIEVCERNALALTEEARQLLGPGTDSWNAGWLYTIERRFRHFVDERKTVRVLLYPNELQARFNATRLAALQSFELAMGLDELPLRREEEDALRDSHHGHLVTAPVAITDRLERVPELFIPEEPGDRVHGVFLYRPEGGGEGLVGKIRDLWFGGVEVIALDAASETLLGTREPSWVQTPLLHAITLEQFEARYPQARP